MITIRDQVDNEHRFDGAMIARGCRSVGIEEVVLEVYATITQVRPEDLHFICAVLHGQPPHLSAVVHVTPPLRSVAALTQAVRAWLGDAPFQLAMDTAKRAEAVATGSYFEGPAREVFNRQQRAKK